MWDVTVVDVLAPSRLNQGSLCYPGTTATKAEARKDNKYIFQLVNIEMHFLGESSEIFIMLLCEMLCRSHDNQQAGTYLTIRWQGPFRSAMRPVF